MNDGGQRALLRLMTWLSPAFPVGAFSYSHGLERAIHDGAIGDRQDLAAWLEDLARHGSGWNDVLLCAQAWRSCGDAQALAKVAELAEAMAGSAERHLETMAQGEAFLHAASPWNDRHPAWPGERVAYPVAVGAVAGRQGVGLEGALAAFLHAFLSNLVQAAVRLVPLGQRDGVATLVALEPVTLEVAARAAKSGLDDLGSATVVSEISSLKHEMQHTRLFRS
jgi:urease accessory protein